MPQLANSSEEKAPSSRTGALAILFRSLKIFLKGFAVLIGLILILSIFKVSIPLGFLKPKFESVVYEALGREFTMERSPRIVIGLKPEFLVEGCSVGNPPDWTGNSGREFARLDRCFIKLGLLPLFKKEIRVDKLEITGLGVNLERTPAGDISWDFDPPSGKTPAKEVTKDKKPKAKSGFKFKELRKLELKDITARTFLPTGEERLALSIASVEGNASGDEKLNVELDGSWFGEPLKGKLTGDSIQSFIKDTGAGWPYEFNGQLAGAAVKIKGALASSDLQEGGAHEFALDAPDFERLESITGPLPKLGTVHLKGKFLTTTEGISLPELTGNLGETTVNGSLVIKRQEEMPIVKGRLELGVIDTAVFGEPQGGDRAPPARKESPGSPPEEPEKKLRDLFPFTGEISLKIEEIINPKVTVEDLELGLRISETSLEAGVSVFFAGSPLQGTLDIRKEDREENPVTVILDLEARNAEFGGLVEFYTGTAGFSGEFESFSYVVKGAGNDPKEAFIQNQTIMEVKNVAMNYKGEDKNIEFQLDRNLIDGAWNRETFMEAEGAFQGERFSVKFDQLKPEKAPPDRAPFIKFTGTAAGATWRLEGETQRTEDDPKPPLEFEVSGRSIGEMHNWIGLPEEADLPYGAKGVVLFEDGWLVDLAEAKLGQTILTGKVGATQKDNKQSYVAQLAIDTIDAGELGLLFNEEAKMDKDPGIDLDAPIFPSKVEIDNADIDVKIGRIVMPDEEIGDLRLKAEMREGWLKEAPFHASFGETKFSGTAGLDFRQAQPEVKLDVTAEAVDIGALFAKLNLVKNMEAKAGEFSLAVHARGSTLREILLESDLDATLTNGEWELRDANTGAKIPLKVKTGSIGGKRGEHTYVNLDGTLSGEAIKMEIKTDAIDALVREDEKIKLSFAGQFADSQFGLEGEATLPIDRMDLDAQLSVSGKRLSDLSELLNADLPPIGPYSLKSRVKVVGEGYSLEGFDILVGETDLSGKVSINTEGKKPRLKADLRTKRVQLADFQTKTWSPRTGSGGDKRTVSDKIVALDQSVMNLLSAKLLGSFDADISLKADDVRSGKDKLGAGSLKTVVNAGRLTVSPVTLSIPGGDFSAYYMWYPRSRDYDSVVRLSTNGFDYGVLARQKDPSSDMKGLIFLDMEITNQGSPIDKFGLDYASGKISFEMCPERLKAGIFDFWGSNLLFAVMPKIDPKNESKINCVIADFVLTDGLMKPEALGIDTTRVRVITDGFIDFKNNKIDLTLVPKSKRPEFLKVGLKIGVTGKVDDFKVDTGPMPILRSLAGMAGSTVLFPGKLLFKERIPLDGSDVCRCGKE